MPVVTLHSALIAVRGRVGDVVFKTYRDKVVVTRMPRLAHVTASPAQRVRRDRLKQATAFAQRVYANAPAKLLYVDEARRLGRQPFRLAVADYLRWSGLPAADLAVRASARFWSVCHLLLPAVPRRRRLPPELPGKSRVNAWRVVRSGRAVGKRSEASARVGMGACCGVVGRARYTTGPPRSPARSGRKREGFSGRGRAHRWAPAAPSRGPPPRRVRKAKRPATD